MLTCYFENNNKAALRHVTVDSIVMKDGKILLVKRAAHLSNPGKYALPGGYLNRDETTTQAALRELKEETGYDGKITQLFRICDKPDRKGEDRQNVTFVFLVEALEKTSNPDDEVQEVKWFDLSSIPPEKMFAFDHFEHVQLCLKYLQEEFSLPSLG